LVLRLLEVSTLNELLNWLEPRLTEVPESLRGRILDTVSGGQSDGRTGATGSASLHRTGKELMSIAKTAPPTHDTAMTLLAADALITFACEAVAEEEPERLAEMR
jgi:hypothetical protein